jgi:hypothetical protein
MQSSRMLIFNRVEHKYFIDRTTWTALERDIRAFIQPDRYTQETGGYLIRSIYFDTFDHMEYNRKMMGVAERHKLRMRVYGENPEDTPFIRFEIKSRYITVIHKITVDIPKEKFAEVNEAIRTYRNMPDWLIHNPDVSKEFFRIQRQYNMKPQILVQYRRRAYEKKEMNRVRVNFDYDLVGSRNLNLFGPLQGGRSLLKYGNCIFELKVDGTMPFWLHKLIAKYDLQNQAISKYCNAVKAQAWSSPHGRPNEFL